MDSSEIQGALRAVQAFYDFDRLAASDFEARYPEIATSLHRGLVVEEMARRALAALGLVAPMADEWDHRQASERIGIPVGYAFERSRLAGDRGPVRLARYDLEHGGAEDDPTEGRVSVDLEQDEAGDFRYIDVMLAPLDGQAS